MGLMSDINDQIDDGKEYSKLDYEKVKKLIEDVLYPDSDKFDTPIVITTGIGGARDIANSRLNLGNTLKGLPEKRYPNETLDKVIQQMITDGEIDYWDNREETGDPNKVTQMSFTFTAKKK